MTTAIIDADIVAFRCAASAEKNGEEEALALFHVDKVMENILTVTAAKEWQGYLSGTTNFRKALNEKYKANRKGLSRPPLLSACKKHLANTWKCKVTNGIEADDAIGIHHTNSPTHSTVVSIDKDFFQLPGANYNFVKDVPTFVGGLHAAKHLYWLMLVGDTSDNVPGIRGIGPVKASKLLDECIDIGLWFKVVRSLYKKEDAIDGDKRFLTNLNLFWIMRNEEELWQNVPEHQSLITPDLVPHVEELQRKFLEFKETLSLQDGSMVSGGTLQNTTSTDHTA